MQDLRVRASFERCEAAICATNFGRAGQAGQFDRYVDRQRQKNRRRFLRSSSHSNQSLKFKFNVAQASLNFGDHTLLIFFALGNERNGETHERAGIIPRHGGDELLADQEL